MNITPLHAWIGDRLGFAERRYTRGDLGAYQLDRLNWVVQYAKCGSRFYRHLFSSVPDPIQSLADWSKLPFTSAEDLRANPNHLACVSQDDIQRIVTLPTSGTTGPSKRVYFTAADQELTVDFFKVGMSTLAGAGDRVLILLPGARPGSVGDLLKTGLERLGCSAIVYGPVDDEAGVLRLIVESNSNVLVGAPVHLHRLARWDEAFGILPKGQIRSVLASTDTLPNVIRANLARLWGCEVFDHWGMTETGLGGGVECEAHNGFHLREVDLFVEIIDPQNGKVLPDGETGEVVITTLTRKAMPFIRYRTGDLGRLLPGDCDCGSFIKRLDRITHRIGAGVQLETGLLTQNDLDEALFALPWLLDFSASFNKRDAMPTLALLVRAIETDFRVFQDRVFEKVNEISSVRAAIERRHLRVTISEMAQPSDFNPHLLPKRVIARQET